MPDTTIAIAIMLGSFVLLLMLRMPISFTLGISSVLTALYLNIPLATLFQRMVSGIQSFSLLAIPFFILAGEIMGQGGISRRLITLANAFVGWMRGGLAQVNILASMFFGGISGSAVADTSSIGSILIPMMTDSGYDKDFSVAVTVTSSCQGVMIPPSHNMILFAMAAGGGVSIGQLFMGGLIPGILLGVALMIMTAIIARKRNYPKGRMMSLKEIWQATKDALLGLMTCIIIVGGVIFGWFGMLLNLGDHTAAVLSITRAIGVLVAAVFIVRMLFATFRGTIHPVGGLGVGTFVLVILFPVVHPWYLLWALVPLSGWADRPQFRVAVVAYSASFSLTVLPRGLGLPPGTVLQIYLGSIAAFVASMAIILAIAWRRKVFGLR